MQQAALSCRKRQNAHQWATDKHCEEVWDGFLCWPSTPRNSVIHLPCPPEKGIDITKFATRHCDLEGRWEKHPYKENVFGWSNYSNCFTKEIKLLLDKLYTSSATDIEKKIQIAKETRMIEVTGLSISLVFLLISICIFIYFSSLRNKRTKIHKHLFFAMFGQVLIRLILYVDQWLSRDSIDDAVRNSAHPYSIENMPVLCEFCYVLMEYSRTSVFMWMLLEGVHLHTSIVLVFPRDVSSHFYYSFGWGFPFVFVIIWTAVMAAEYPTTICWWGYALSVYYWILEGPRICIIIINFIILLNIVRVVVMKVQVNTPSEFQQIRKAVRAALLLLPLLGITNIMDVIPGPVEGTPQQFAAWAYTAHILGASQGLFISLLYCFLNKEVQEAIRKHWSFYKFSRKSILICWKKPETCTIPRIRPVTEEKEESRNDAKGSSQDRQSVL